MRRSIAPAIALALLGLIAVAAAAGVAKAAAALDHACCPHEARTDPGDDAPCHGFLPLSCCNAAALPTSAASAAEPSAALLAIPIALVVEPLLASRAPVPAHAVPAPHAAPVLRSVVLQL